MIVGGIYVVIVGGLVAVVAGLVWLNRDPQPPERRKYRAPS